jgi:hypothetical protein
VPLSRKLHDWRAGRKSPKAAGAAREEEVPLLDSASPTRALARVRVRIEDMVFVRPGIVEAFPSFRSPAGRFHSAPCFATDS